MKSVLRPKEMAAAFIFLIYGCIGFWSIVWACITHWSIAWPAIALLGGVALVVVPLAWAYCVVRGGA